VEPLHKAAFAVALLAVFFVEPAVGQVAVRIDRVSAEEFASAKDKKGVVVISVNWNRQWRCGGYENAQLKGIGFDRIPISKSSDDAEADILLDDAPMLFTKPGFDEYAFVVEPGEYALSFFDVKVARSVRDIGGFKATRSNLTKEGKPLAGSFDVGAGEIIYIGHFFLDCHRQPIPWRYYLENREIFEKYKGHIKSRWSIIETEKMEFRLFRTKDFGNDFKLP